MLYYKELKFLEGIHVNKTSETTEGDTGIVKVQPNVFNTCHNSLMSMNLSDIAILNIEGSNFCCINSGITKSETINLISI